MFKAGQKVVCINVDGMNEAMIGPPVPELNKVYTIRGFLDCPAGLGLYLEEITRPLQPSLMGVIEWAFQAYRFRPVVEKKTDISIFTAMLKTDKKTIDA